MDADAFTAAAHRLYPQHAPTAPVEAPAPASAPATPATPPEAASEQPEGHDNSVEAIAARMYPDRPEWSGMVDLNEPPPTDATAYKLDTPGDLADLTETGRAAEANVRAAFLNVGCPASLATELWRDAVSATRGGVRRQSAESAEAELLGKWGATYDRRMTEVRAVVKQAAAASPELMPFLLNTGLAASPKFLAKISAFASRRPRGI